MNIDYLIQLLGNRLNALALAKDQAFTAGDLERINVLEVEMHSVNDTLARLNLINTITQAALVHGGSEADIVATGIELIRKNMSNPDLKFILGGYDISSYATDPLHEQKITNILDNMPVLSNVVEIDSYIQSVAPGSPVTAVMILMAANTYKVDHRLLLALMQQDSSFGTAGLATSTLNPGNVGNTGSAVRYYASWQEGVMAVAEWLSNHRVIKAEEVVQEIIKPVAEVVAPVENNIQPEDNQVIEEIKPEDVATSTTENNLDTSNQAVDIKIKKVDKIK